MITVSVSPGGKCYVWNANDWFTLRGTHRIVGELNGVLANLPIQDNCSGLPMALLPEETTLLLEKNLVKLTRFPSLERCPGDGVRDAYRNHCRKASTDQEQQMKEERKQALTGLIDKIIQGRRRKQLGLDTKKSKSKSKKIKGEEDHVKLEDTPNTEKVGDEKVENQPIDDAEREAVMQEELSKTPKLSKEHTLVQTFTAYPWLRNEDACPVEWTFPQTPSERTRYFTYKDLWERGYHITSGHKFGGDFLVYPGDPFKFHSQFIVSCVDHEEPLSVLQLISYGRISSSVRKTIVLASLLSDSNEVAYQSIKWPGAKLSYAK